MNSGNGDDFDRGAGGPNIVAAGLWGPSERLGRVLTKEERAHLAVISTVTRFAKGNLLYRKGNRAEAIFNLISGVVKSYKTEKDGSRHIAGFLFPDDLVGLAEEGTYVNSAEAVTSVTAYRIPTSALEGKLRQNPLLEFHVICKLCHELREAQRHAFLLTRRRALAKVGLFLEMLEQQQAAREESIDEIYMPMRRSDIASYIGISLEAASRSFRILADRGVIAFRNRQHVKVLRRAALEALVAEN